MFFFCLHTVGANIPPNLAQVEDAPTAVLLNQKTVTLYASPCMINISKQSI